jgi:hypothetical protein
MPMKCFHRLPPAARFAAVLAAALLLGCGGSTPADPDLARATLTAALDAWRDGRTIDEVSSGSPPITVADPAWKAGFKLSRYEVASNTRPVGFDLRMPVKLWLEDPKGKPVEESAKYTVSVQPARTVIRAPL